ncbi:hypothetical protein AB1Y20_022685 [Prymnesium parvum]|uniref:RING-type domain-containing protein n=1 Tax=Prymnesium parvum TaxID=97485 RepID=A0AB34JK78_PRYPA
MAPPPLSSLSRASVRTPPGLASSHPHHLSPLGVSSQLLLSAALLLVGVLICCIIQVMSCRMRRKSHRDEDLPLLARDDSPRHECDSDGFATIGTPARDFVRLSSLPPAIFRAEEDQRRCLACGEAGKCVSLRPCGHIVLCRACSDYVYTCPNPNCGKYITGVGLCALPNPSDDKQR